MFHGNKKAHGNLVEIAGLTRLDGINFFQGTRGHRIIYLGGYNLPKLLAPNDGCRATFKLFKSRARCVGTLTQQFSIRRRHLNG